jgi:hypothetical protein
MPEVVVYPSASSRFKEALSRAERALTLAKRTDWSGNPFDLGCPLGISATASITVDSQTQSLSEGIQTAIDALDAFCQRSFHFELLPDIRPRRRPGVKLSISFSLSKRTLSILEDRYRKGPEAAASNGKLLCQ